MRQQRVRQGARRRRPGLGYARSVGTAVTVQGANKVGALMELKAAVAQVDRARQALSSKGGKGEVKVNGPSPSPFINQLDN